MVLQTIDELDSNYRQTFTINDIKRMSVYPQGINEKIGTVSDIILDNQGQLRYLVLDLGIQIFGKKILLPVSCARVSYKTNRVYVDLTRKQAEALPGYNERTVLNHDYEEKLRAVYRTQPELSAVSTSVYEMNEQDSQTLRLYEERLIANKNRFKAGEVAVGKHIETETAQVSVPIRKERVVIERVTSPGAGKPLAFGEFAFTEGEVARLEVYEETPEIHKQAFVREEIRVKKLVEQQTVEAQETLRKEDLDINTEGHPVVERI
ncbi:DUF2382 domain-containing protein [Fischerella sp. PCC 9605]|uniref:DUF2382 domain-containing protein n=1 Tax=Fischerella sp. PCC 9605 TaxID=1173024 RepID=UPI00047920FA|nr:DUF2382 domain-containing protein [Fischerella sp. PCC 9605]